MSPMPTHKRRGRFCRHPASYTVTFFVAVQTQGVYPDQKTFVDAIPKIDPAQIVQAYHQQMSVPGFSLATFVAQYFTPPTDQVITPPPNQSLREHIDWLWPELTRLTTTANVPANSSLIPMPKQYVVPGGRFREGYYWDTYFTMLGLQEAGREDLVDDMLDNFAYLIDTIGHIPNGNRTYYVSRSQPPFFSYMVELAAHKEGGRVYQKYLPQLRREHDYWMQGADTLQPGGAVRNVVMMPDKTVLNRYWDERDTPRDESYWKTGDRQAGHEPSGERGVSRLACGGRKRLGLQLALVRRQYDACDDPHDIDHSRRFE